MRSKGYTSKSFVYGETRPLLGKRCPVEGLAENMAHRLYPAYMASTVPDTYLAKLTSAEIVTFLTANGVEPGQVERDLTATSVVLRRAGHQIAPNPQPFRA